MEYLNNAQWYYFADNKWEALGFAASNNLEEAFRNGTSYVTIQNNDDYNVDIAESTMSLEHSNRTACTAIKLKRKSLLNVPYLVDNIWFRIS